jgi:2-keto-4-pentenoate hydratase
LEPTDVAGAYAVRQINTRFWQDSGRRIVGRKIGLTSIAVQKQLGVDRPDYGVLFDDAMLPNDGELPRSCVLQPKAEAEVAIILARDLNNPMASADDVLAASECAVAACLGHPLIAAAWLARTLASNDEGLKAGDILLTGALGPMTAISPGDAVVARIGGLGRVGFTFRDDLA